MIDIGFLKTEKKKLVQIKKKNLFILEKKYKTWSLYIAESVHKHLEILTPKSVREALASRQCTRHFHGVEPATSCSAISPCLPRRPNTTCPGICNLHCSVQI